MAFKSSFLKWFNPHIYCSRERNKVITAAIRQQMNLAKLKLLTAQLLMQLGGFQ